MIRDSWLRQNVVGDSWFFRNKKTKDGKNGKNLPNKKNVNYTKDSPKNKKNEQKVLRDSPEPELKN